MYFDRMHMCSESITLHSGSIHSYFERIQMLFKTIRMQFEGERRYLENIQRMHLEYI